MTLLLEESNTPNNDNNNEANPPAPKASPRWARRILIGFGIMSVTAAAAAIALAAPHLGDGTGDSSYHPTAFADIDHEYSSGIGTLNVDLRDVDFPHGTHTIKIDHGIGSARVWLPTNVNYQVTGDLNMGEIDLFGETDSGFFDNNLNAHTNINSQTTIIVDLEVDIGYGQVRQG
jgi:hypothetical protein